MSRQPATTASPGEPAPAATREPAERGVVTIRVFTLNRLRHEPFLCVAVGTLGSTLVAAEKIADMIARHLGP